MTMWSVTQTHRFRAAVSGAGLANWLSYYGENGIDKWMDAYFGGNVYDHPDVYAKSSPITFIKNVQTPTLVVVGDRDIECPPPQSYEFWARASHDERQDRIRDLPGRRSHHSAAGALARHHAPDGGVVRSEHAPEWHGHAVSSGWPLDVGNKSRRPVPAHVAGPLGLFPTSNVQRRTPNIEH